MLDLLFWCEFNSHWTFKITDFETKNQNPINKYSKPIRLPRNVKPKKKRILKEKMHKIIRDNRNK